MNLTQQQIREFQTKILNWYRENKRDLPWRHTHDPYRILVSEIMSQQTQIARVIPKYEAWITRFPNLISLANAANAEVLHYWSGLGYNRRALYLQKCAKEIIEKYNGKFPDKEEDLIKLPGIGTYTARAVLSFAFERQVSVIDINVKKVILLEILKSSITDHIPDKTIEDIASEILPPNTAYDWNQALMDYSAAVLKKEKIPLKKQSPFKNSNRYFRGGIMRLLLKHKKLSMGELQGLLLREEKKEINISRLTEILHRLVKDLLIKQDEKTQFYTL